MYYHGLYIELFHRQMGKTEIRGSLRLINTEPKGRSVYLLLTGQGLLYICGLDRKTVVHIIFRMTNIHCVVKLL